MIDNTGVSNFLSVSVNSNSILSIIRNFSVWANKIDVVLSVWKWKTGESTLLGVLSKVSKCEFSEKTMFQDMVVISFGSIFINEEYRQTN
jgi:hypothetical protein